MAIKINEIPARNDDPPPSPRRVKKTRLPISLVRTLPSRKTQTHPNNGKTLAIDDLKRSFPASTDPTCFGYETEMYIRIDWKVRNIPMRYREAPMMGTIQCTDSRDDHPKINNEMGMKTLPNKPISRNASGGFPLFLAKRGSRTYRLYKTYAAY